MKKLLLVLCLFLDNSALVSKNFPREPSEIDLIKFKGQLTNCGNSNADVQLKQLKGQKLCILLLNQKAKLTWRPELKVSLRYK